jgi:hypothetical protein
MKDCLTGCYFPGCSSTEEHVAEDHMYLQKCFAQVYVLVERKYI